LAASSISGQVAPWLQSRIPRLSVVMGSVGLRRVVGQPRV
jgi:hypothetical protein